MGAISDFNVQGLSAIQQEVRDLLGGATAAVECGLVGVPDQALLATAAKRLISASGALQMVGLDGPARFATEIAKLVAVLQERTVMSSALGAGACKRACAEFSVYLDELLKGRKPVLLRLFQAFREVRLAHGAEAVCESELFYPRLNVELPALAPGARAPGREAAAAGSTRTQFQKGLLRWLQERDREGLQTMREAVIATESQQSEPSRRLFWTATAAFLDAVTEDGLSREARVTQLLPRLDLLMKKDAEGAQDTDDALLREMLYFVAVSQPVTERIKTVQSAFDLDSYLPSLGEVQQRELSEAFIPEIRACIAETKSAWNGWTGSSDEALNGFRNASRRLVQLAQRAGHMPMASLLEAFAELADVLARREMAHTQSLALYIATLLVWVEQAVDSGAWCDAGFTSAMQIFAKDVRAVSAGGTEPTLDFNHVMERNAQGRAELANVVEPVNVALNTLRQGVEEYVRDPSKGKPLEALAPTFTQLAGVFTLLEFETAARLVKTAQGLSERLAVAADQQQIELLADAITSARAFFETVQAEPVRAEQLARDALRRQGVQVDDLVEEPVEVAVPATETPGEEVQAAFTEAASLTFTHLATPDSVRAAIEAPAAAVQTAAPEAKGAVTPPPAAVEPATLDPELLEVFLEEANEVLATVGEHLARLTANGSDQESLTTVRRGFHTLKGSGRMVGLVELGEVAWLVEEVMNKWLQRKEQPTAELIGLASATLSKFQAWVTDLKAGTPVSFEAGEIVALAERLRGESTQQRPEARKEVKVGNVTLGHTLYRILLSEAESRVLDLKRQSEGLGPRPAPSLKADLMRAAHTLAGIAQNTGFAALAELAHALERWAQTSMDRAGALGADEPKAVASAVAALEKMVQDIREQRAPEPVPAQVAALEALIGGGSRADSGPKERRQVRDDIDNDLLPLFLEEAEELQEQMAEAVRKWREAPADEQAQRALARALHTLKGSSRMAGGLRLGELAHKIESMVEAATDKTPAFFEQLVDMVDRVGSALEALQGGLGTEEAAAAREATVDKAGTTTTVARLQETTSTAASPELPAAPEEDAAAAVAPTDVEAEAGPILKQQFLKVAVDSVSELGDEAAEINIVRSRLEGQLVSSRQSLVDLADNVDRLRKQLREMEIQAESQIQSRMVQVQDSAEGFDPLEFDRFTRIQELTRFMTESVHDVAAIQHNLLEKVDETEVILRQQGRINRELQDGLAKLRMVPLSTITERLNRTVRQAARALGKKARLEITGERVELDRSLLERLTAPLEHLLRNAVAHGMQEPEARVRAGKPETGEIVLTATQAANQLKVVVRDDGAGLDLEQVRAKAMERGLLDPGTEMSDADVMHLIFTPGFSTAQAVSEVAGRGVGLDVVKTEIAGLGGSVEVHSVSNQGVSFEIRVPLTRTVTKAVLVRGGARLYALPSASVEQVLRLESEQMVSVRREAACHWSGSRYPFTHLRELFGEQRQEDKKRSGLVVLARSGHERVAIEVDGLVGNREIAIKQLGPQLSRLPWIMGGSVLGDGQVVLIVDPLRIARGSQQTGAKPVAEEKQQVRTILVVDDSLTVRKITDRVLSRQGYKVVTAKDGVDALELLQGTMPDLALVDIEMPRMDGFELTKRVRASARTAALPIIMITSRTADKHRNYAQQIGVNAYLGKPYEVEELLAQMATLLGGATELPRAA